MSGKDQSSFVAIVPAGGSGVRAGGDLPKQYQSVAGQPILAHTLNALLTPQWMEEVHVIVAPDESYWQQDAALIALTMAHPSRLHWHRVGGQTRQETVLAGLLELSIESDPWVMVHDAARPGVDSALLDSLRLAVADGAEGALLATRVADTVKVDNHGQPAQVASTTSRDHLWLAQTPQVFRRAQLRQVLSAAQISGTTFTDESSAMESAGVYPVLVPGSWKNFKVTTATDFDKAALILSSTVRAGVTK